MYDVAIAGAGVAGSALASALGKQGRRVLLVERDLRPPQLFVGELLQPGGVASLRALGLSSCIEGIDAQPTVGFAVAHNGGCQALDYPRSRDGEAVRGFAFHHGRFVNRLREAAKGAPGVELREGTVVGLLREAGRVCGIAFRDRDGKEHNARARLVVAADGRNSRLRRDLGVLQPERLSYSVGVLMHGAELPCPGYGHVFVTDASPMLSYRIGSDEVRVLVDLRGELPSSRDGNLEAVLRSRVAPQLPEQVQEPFLRALGDGRPRAMPNYSLVPRPEREPGSVMLGDALNMRHPVTGGGMTVALNDVVMLSERLVDVSLGDPVKLDRSVRAFYRARQPLSLTIDALANSLYDVFRAEGPGLDGMRDAMLRYWQLGGPAKDGPMAMLSGLEPRPALLLLHYTAVAAMGMGSTFVPRGTTAATLAPGFKGASQVAAEAFATIRPHLWRAFSPSRLSA